MLRKKANKDIEMRCATVKPVGIQVQKKRVIYDRWYARGKSKEQWQHALKKRMNKKTKILNSHRRLRNM